MASLPPHWPASLLARLVPRPFFAGLESDYYRWLHARYLGSWRAFLVSAFLVYALFAAWDYIVAPSQHLLFIPVRLLCCALLLVLLAATYSSKAHRNLTRDLWLVLISYNLVLNWILSVVPGGWQIGPRGFAFSILAVMVLPQARLMAANSLIMLFLANGSMWLTGTDNVTRTSANFHLLGLSLMAYVLIFVNEARDRRLFELEQYLERLATVDALSGAYNRRHFTHLAEAELQRAQRYSSPVALLFLDIDHFKKINDAFGHARGDDAIRTLCDTARRTLRQSDVLGRLGGEEFAVLLPETDLDAARVFAERLRTAIAEAHLSLEAHPEVLCFTVSIGAVAAHHDDTFDTLLHRADVALYKAKDAGRNRVVTLETI